ncbi:MAG: N-acetyl-gamma-glutamyl-phosphate reductase [Lentisphaeria bacterium]|nr:N-acetyl-gamma-glutamyl-phosphate reductase [Lentisphaeria bacterium]
MKVFIDGSAGTTGLRIHERLASRADIELIVLSEEYRKDKNARHDAINSADIAFLCLPDDAAREAVTLIEGDTAVIDTSTAHRVAPGWVYGFPELPGQREKIASGRRIANPGCHASGFVSLVAPLVKAGLLAKDAALTCFSVTGYSGGGKKMIAEYEAPTGISPLLGAPRQYGISQTHKHLPEMAAICGLENAPVFCPIVANFYSGMEVTVPRFGSQLKGTREDVKNAYKERYTTPLVHFDDGADEAGFLSAAAFSGYDDMQISVAGNSSRMILTARFDNLGKGASGSAIQNMNILMGVDETCGLVLSRKN